MKDLHFARMAISTSRATIAVTFLRDRIPFSSKQKVDDATRRYNNILRSIPLEVDRFVDRNFSNGHTLLRLLSGLHKGSESTHFATKELTTLYRNTTKKLQDKLKMLLQRVEREVDMRGCFDDAVEVLHSLIPELDAGLKNHIDISDLPFECNDKLRQWREKAKNGEESLDFEAPDVESKL